MTRKSRYNSKSAMNIVDMGMAKQSPLSTLTFSIQVVIDSTDGLGI